MLSPRPRLTCALDSFVLLAFCSLQFAFIFGFPWFDNGVRPRIEGPTSAIHLSSALLALGVGIQMARKNESYIRAARSPLVLALFAFALLSAAFAPLTGDPARSFNGTVKHGIGVYWHLEFALATLAATALWERAVLRKSMVWVAGIAAATIVATYAIPDNPFGTPQAFSEWSGLLAISVSAAITLAAFDDRELQGRWRTGGVIIVALATVLAFAGYLVSENRTILLAVIAVSFFLFSTKIPVIRKLAMSPIMRSVTVIATALALSGCIYLAGPFIEKMSVPDAESFTPSIASENVLDQAAIQDEALGSIWSRSYLERIQLDDVLSRPESLIYGNGFGFFGTVYERSARDVPGRLFPNATETSSKLYWDAHHSANFHSHNMFSEMLSSTGLFGVTLWLLAFGIMAWSSVRGAAVALGVVVVGSFWFPLNLMMGSMALLTAASAFSGRESTARMIADDRRSMLLAGTGSLVAVFGCAFFGLMAYSSIVLAQLERFERAFRPVEVNSNIETCGFLKTRLFSEREIVAELYAILRIKIEKAREPKKQAFDSTTNLISMNCMLRRYFEEKGDLRALVTSLEGRSSLVFIGPQSYGGLRTEIVKWGDDLELMLDAVPARTELIAPYIAALNMRAPQKVNEETERFLPRIKDHDPIRYYLLAVQAKAVGDDTRYATFFAEAMRRGLANLWPVKAIDQIERN